MPKTARGSSLMKKNAKIIIATVFIFFGVIPLILQSINAKLLDVYGSFIGMGLVIGMFAFVVWILKEAVAETNRTHKESVKNIDKAIGHNLNCDFCGTKINSQWHNCPNCGAVLEPTRDKQYSEAIESENKRYDKESKATKITLKVILIYISVNVAFVLLGLLIMTILTRAFE